MNESAIGTWSRSDNSVDQRVALEAINEFERSNKVGEYVSAGFRVWPVLRVVTSYELLKAVGARESSSDARNGNPQRFKWVPKFWNAGLRALSKGKEHIDSTASFLQGVSRGRTRFSESDLGKSTLAGSDRSRIVIKTSSDRRIKIGRTNWHPIADPMILLAESIGCRAISWEEGNRVDACRIPPFWITDLLKQGILEQSDLVEQLCPDSPPGWFREYSAFINEAVGFQVKWQFFAHLFRMVAISEIVATRWLQDVRCDVLFLDTWYNPFSMALTRASRSLGVTAIEIQHGHQQATHFAYSRWHHYPDQAYDVVPDYSWVWGEHDAAQAQAEFRLPMQPLVGGNLWLNLWHRQEDVHFSHALSSARRLVAGFKRTILVTTQPTVSLAPVYEAIKRSPRDWLWLIRPHPRTPEDISSRIREGTDGCECKVEIELTRKLPLYALMAVADQHVTGYSTCALEALAFECRTVLIHATGLRAFAEFIEQGLMVDGVSQDCLKAIDCQADDFVVSQRARLVFADDESSRRSLEKILRFAERAAASTRTGAS